MFFGFYVRNSRYAPLQGFELEIWQQAPKKAGFTLVSPEKAT